MTLGALLLTAVPGWAIAQAGRREVGTVMASGSVVWVRATNDGQVELFMSQGYRDALARPALLDADRLAAWTDTARALQRPSAGLVDARSGATDDSGVVLDRWLGTDSAGLRIQRSGTTVMRMSDTPARQLVDLLAEAAQLTLQLSSPSPVVSTAATTPATTLATTPATTPAAAELVDSRSAGPAPTIAAAPPQVPAAPPTPTPAPSLAIEDTVPALPVRTPSLRASLDHTLPREAPAEVAALGAVREPGVAMELASPPMPVATLADKHMQTPLGPFVVPGAKLADHDTQIDYCYTELGLRYDRRLTGDVTIHVTVSSTGAPDTVEVTKRTWDGVPAAEVESCMRSLIEDWSFGDSGPLPATIELHFTLAPGKEIGEALR